MRRTVAPCSGPGSGNSPIYLLVVLLNGYGATEENGCPVHVARPAGEENGHRFNHLPRLTNCTSTAGRSRWCHPMAARPPPSALIPNRPPGQSVFRTAMPAATQG